MDISALIEGQCTSRASVESEALMSVGTLTGRLSPTVRGTGRGRHTACGSSRMGWVCSPDEG